MMTAIDSAIVLAWLVGVLVIGILAGLKTNLEGFWVNKRKTSLAPLVFTIVATQVGGGTIVGISSAAYASGTGFGLVALVSTVSGLLAIAWLAPWAKRFGDRNSAYTLPEVLHRRYGRAAQVAAGCLILFSYLSLLGGQFLSLGVFITAWTGFSPELALVLGFGGAIVYAAFAGLRGDIVTDTLHFWAMAVGLFCVFLPAVVIKEDVRAAIAAVPLRLWSPVTFGGYTYLIAGVLLGALIPIVMMEMWMRVYAASDATTARKSFVWSAVAVIPFYLLPMFVGLIVSQLPRHIDNADYVLAQTMFASLPKVLLGIAVAAFVAVIVSTANTLVVVLGAVLYRDILNRRSAADDKRELLISRAINFCMGMCGLVFALLVPSVVQLMLNTFFVIGMIAPVLLGLTIWKRATSKGAVVALVLGGITTIACLPIMPAQAFVPGLALSVISFFVVSGLTRHSANEDLGM